MSWLIGSFSSSGVPERNRRQFKCTNTTNTRESGGMSVSNESCWSTFSMSSASVGVRHFDWEFIRSENTLSCAGCLWSIDWQLRQEWFLESCWIVTLTVTTCVFCYLSGFSVTVTVCCFLHVCVFVCMHIYIYMWCVCMYLLCFKYLILSRVSQHQHFGLCNWLASLKDVCVLSVCVLRH